MKNEDNPYWERIQEIAKRQREKGIKEYGQGIEFNQAALEKRIDMLIEEVVDVTMYLLWVEDAIRKGSKDGITQK